MLSAVILLRLSILSFSISPISCRRVDKLRESKAHGAAVTNAAIKLIQDTCMFDNDHQFMRRLAWVSSEFGDKADTFTKPNINKGIWKLTEKQFKLIKWNDTVVTTSKTLFKLNPNEFKWNKGDMMVPLKGALAARQVLDKNVPLSIDLQAKYWAKHYAEHGTEEDFKKAVHSLPDPCGGAGADVLFILDASGSICNWKTNKNHTCKNYENMKRFVEEVIKKLPLGETTYRWAVDTFNQNVSHIIPFNSYGDNRTLLAENVAKIPYNYTSATCTWKVLREAVSVSFSSASGARSTSKGYPRVVILLTDGVSGNETETIKAAQFAKDHGLTLFTIGITKKIGERELRGIASDPKCMHVYKLAQFKALLEDFPTELKQRTCGSSSVITVSSNQTTITNVVGEGIYMYFEFKATMCFGMTLIVEMHTGASGFYMSLEERNPTEVIYDYNIDADTTNKGQIFLAPKQLNSSFVSVTVYGSIVGKQKSNSFTITINQGDARGASGKLEVTKMNYFVMGLLAFLKFFIAYHFADFAAF